MREVEELFQRALGLVPPWRVERSEFDAEARRLDLYLDFERGARFGCLSCDAEGCPVHDTEDKEWRHLDFMQHRMYLHARVPRIRCERCGVRQVEPPWARPGSGFTHLFEALVMTLAAEMPIKAIAELIGEHDTRIWRIVHHHIERARERLDLSQVDSVGVDETSRRRGHHYASLFVDLAVPRLIFATKGRDAESFARFRADLEAHGGTAERIAELCMDMSPSYIAGAAEHLPDAQITFDRYHLMQNLNFALDQVRRQEQQGSPGLKKTRYLWLRNPGRLSDRQRAELDRLATRHDQTGRAYRIKLAFQELYAQSPGEAEAYLERWYGWAIRSRLEPIKEFARSVKEHWRGVLRWFESKVNNGILEAIGSLIQAAKRRARGYRTTENLIAVAYLAAGKLDFATHTR